MRVGVEILFLCAALAPLGGAAAGADAPAWQPVEWNGEPALASSAHGWKAVVSLARARLVQFGPDAPGAPNLLFAPAARDDAAGRGGHRVWLGPQSTWAAIWPPPAAWERSAAESHAIEGAVLRLRMPDAGDGWPRIDRTYCWDGAALVCGVELRGGTRPAQIIQIIQVPQAAVIETTAHPDAAAPAGYVLLPSSATRSFTADFPAPPHVRRTDNALELRHVGKVAKLGFRPQPLVAREGEFVLTVRRAASNGQVAGEPDRGFSTQVYLGVEPFIELEQLTGLFSPAAPTAFEIVLEGAKR